MEQVGFSQLIDSTIDYKMRDRYTAIPAVVLKVHKSGNDCTIDAQPLVSIRERDGTSTPQSSVLNVPYQQPASSVGGMLFPLNVGDSVLLVYSMRGIDTWKYGDGSPSASSDYRMFSKMDCIAIPSIFPVSKSPVPQQKHTNGYVSGDVVVYNAMNGNMCEIILKSDGNVIINSPATVTVNCQNSVVNAEDSITTHSGNNTTINAGSDVNITAGNNVSIESGRDTTINSGRNTIITSTGRTRISSGAGSTISTEGNAVVSAGESAVVYAEQDAQVISKGNSSVSSEGWSEMTAKGPVLIKAESSVRVKGSKGVFTL